MSGICSKFFSSYSLNSTRILFYLPHTNLTPNLHFSKPLTNPFKPFPILSSFTSKFATYYSMEKVLVANRGEIALRVMRSAKEMGIATVAIYSEADRLAPFVKYADEAVCIGPPPSNLSYLNMASIIAAAEITNSDAIHPGYGFLSENANFARLVKQSGLVLIGPTAESMEMMGDKLSAKSAAKKYNIPLVPGTDGAISDHEEAKKVAKEVGFPILIKASAGGGGKGMRKVEDASQLFEAAESASSEAMSSFGDGTLFLEKFFFTQKKKS
jgi:acetyl/propionyl-CoA carboxylase alpha subunit